MKGAGKVEHLARWFDYVSELPECKAALEELDPTTKRKMAAADSTEGRKGGGGKSDLARMISEF